MNKTLIILALLSFKGIFGQVNPTEEAQPIVAEGKLLYKSEMASWYGTDLFLEKYDKRENIGGYFSYSENDISKCVFFSKTETPDVIGTISFDSTFNLKTSKVELIERDFTNYEKDLYEIRKLALNELNSNTDGLFKFYENTNPNLIPLISKTEKKVYVLTGPQKSGVIIFGNDYLLTFNESNKLTDKKQLHKNIMPFDFRDIDEKEMVSAMHSHLPETGDFITATDICTLMLYSKYTKWKTYNVLSENYLNIWNCEENQLTVIPNKSVKEITDDQEKKNSKRN